MIAFYLVRRWRCSFTKEEVYVFTKGTVE